LIAGREVIDARETGVASGTAHPNEVAVALPSLVPGRHADAATLSRVAEARAAELSPGARIEPELLSNWIARSELLAPEILARARLRES